MKKLLFSFIFTTSLICMEQQPAQEIVAAVPQKNAAQKTIDLSCWSSRDCEAWASELTTDEAMHVETLLVGENTVYNSEGELRINTLVTIAQKCPNIRCVRIKNNDGITSTTIEQAVECWPKLEEIEFIGCPQITNATLCSIAHHCPMLTRFVIDYAAYKLCTPQPISDEGIIELARYCQQLTEVTIGTGNPKKGCVSDASIRALVANCPNLKIIKLYDCTGITNRTLLDIAHYCHQLTDLCLRGLNNPELDTFYFEQVLMNCPLLSRLELYFCNWFTDATLYAIAKHCPHLKALHFNDSSCINSRQTYGVSEAGVMAVAQRCHELTDLTLQNDSWYHDATPPAFSATALTAFAQNCPHLKTLTLVDIMDCLLVTDEILDTFSTQCKELGELRLIGCGHITDQGIGNTAQKCEHLISVTLDKCNKLTNSALIALLQNCHQLRELIVPFGCGEITAYDVSQEAFPHVQFHAFLTSTPKIRNMEGK